MGTAHTSSQTPPTVFICYAHKNNQDPGFRKQWLDILLDHLAPLEMEGQIRIWCDQRIEKGEIWDDTIKAALTSTRVAILLLSPAFYASKYIRDTELPILLAQHAAGDTTLIPIVLSACRLKETKFTYKDPTGASQSRSLNDLQGANSLSNPLTALSEPEQDKILLSVAQRVEQLITANPSEVASAPVTPAATAPAIAKSSLSAGKRQRLEAEQARIQQEWQAVHEKLSYFRQELNTQAGAAATFQLNKQIETEETKLKQLEEKLDQLDADLSS